MDAPPLIQKAFQSLRNLNSEASDDALETQARKIPATVFFGLASVSIAYAAYLTFARKKPELGAFVGVLALTFLILGTYNRIGRLEEKLSTPDGIEHAAVHLH